MLLTPCVLSVLCLGICHAHVSRTQPATTMGVTVDVNLSSLNSFDVRTLKQRVLEHGVIVIKNQSLTVSELEKVVQSLGKTIFLPTQFNFRTTPGHDSISIVSNMDATGAVIANHSAAQYWHQDGDFNVGELINVWNVLHAKIVPTEGGHTGFVDSRRAVSRMSGRLLHDAQACHVRIDPREIPDFHLDDSSEGEYPVVHHPIIRRHAASGNVSLYMGMVDESDLICDGRIASSVEQIREHLKWSLLEDEMNMYVHEWEVGDTLIWDNTVVFHRSCGGYDTPRLLWRSQARMFVSE